MIGFSTQHTRDTAAPQNYWDHAKVAIGKSFGLIWLGIAGVIHGVLPEIKGLQFYTSSGVLRAAKFLILSGRHDREILEIFGNTTHADLMHFRLRTELGYRYQALVMKRYDSTILEKVFDDAVNRMR